MPQQLIDKSEVIVAIATGFGFAIKFAYDGARQMLTQKKEDSKPHVDLERAVALLAEAMKNQTRLLEQMHEEQKTTLQLINRVDVKVDALRLDVKSH